MAQLFLLAVCRLEFQYYKQGQAYHNEWKWWERRRSHWATPIDLVGTLGWKFQRRIGHWLSWMLDCCCSTPSSSITFFSPQINHLRLQAFSVPSILTSLDQSPNRKLQTTRCPGHEEACRGEFHVTLAVVNDDLGNHTQLVKRAIAEVRCVYTASEEWLTRNNSDKN